jgi:hypothetical protein
MLFRYRNARNLPVGEFGEQLALYAPTADDSHPLWQAVERARSAIDERDNWSALEEKISVIRELGQALGEPHPLPGTPLTIKAR